MAVAWLETLVRTPPTKLSELEALIGSLDVDFPSPEGLGLVRRPDPEKPGRGRLRPGLVHVIARFDDRRRPRPRHERERDMSVSGLVLGLDVSPGVVTALLEAQFGPGRAFTSVHGLLVEYGRPEPLTSRYGPWFYVGASVLYYESQRPDWAIPAPPPGAQQTLLHTLHDRLICDTDLAAVWRALELPAAQASAQLLRDEIAIAVIFRVAIPLADVLATLRWTFPVATQNKLSTTYSVSPHHLGPRAAHINGWIVDVQLDDLPRDATGAALPALDEVHLDARTCVTDVDRIEISRQDDR